MAELQNHNCLVRRSGLNYAQKDTLNSDYDNENKVIYQATITEIFQVHTYDK